MAIGKVKGRVAGSVDDLKKSLKKSGGGGDWLLRVKADTELQFYILREPDGWFDYWEHYIKDHGFFPCNDGDCLGCDAGNNPSKRVALPVVDLDESRTRVLALPKSAVEQLLKRYDRYHTMMDRTYIVSRQGSGQDDTTYDVDTGSVLNDRLRRTMQKYLKEIPDVEEAVAAQIPHDEDDDDIFASRRARKPGARKPASRSLKRDHWNDDRDGRPRTTTRAVAGPARTLPGKPADDNRRR